jgi:NTE family protein
MTAIGVVLQGGGALGAFEWGAVKRLVEHGFVPKVLTGVSIGAINTAAIAGARHGDIIHSLDTLWHEITIPTVPFLPPEHQAALAMFGNPRFYRLRTDLFNALSWTNLCDVSPMRETLARLCDFERLNDTRTNKVAFTATNVQTGQSARFSNLTTRLGPDHVLASGSLPPGFPMTEIDGQMHWDGGLFDNTPLRALVEMLSPEEAEHLPIFILDLFPESDAIPTNLLQVRDRMMEISFENRFWDDFGGPEGLKDHAAMLRALDRALPADSALRQQPAYRRMMEYRALANLHVVPAPHVPMTGGMDFSAYTVRDHHDRGYRAMSAYLAERVIGPAIRLAPQRARHEAAQAAAG